MPYALYNPHQKLAAGNWYWQYKSGDGPWSKTNAFKVNEKSQFFATPDAQGLITKVGDSGVMHAMTVGYDSFYDRLSTRQREKLLQAIGARGAHFYEDWVNFLEARLISNHVWQHILERFFQTTLAVIGDLSIAAEWLAYTCEVWLANSSKLGHRDGA